MAFKEAFRPTIGKIIVTIILLVGWFYSYYNGTLPLFLGWLQIGVFIIFFFPTLLGIGAQGSPNDISLGLHLVAILWSYFLVCLIFYTINFIRGKNGKEKNRVVS